MSRDKFQCPSYDGSTRDVQDSIDKRSAAIMDLERKFRLAIDALNRIVQADALTYDMECRFMKDIAKEALAQCKKR